MLLDLGFPNQVGVFFSSLICAMYSGIILFAVSINVFSEPGIEDSLALAAPSAKRMRCQSSGDNEIEMSLIVTFPDFG